MDQRGCPLLQSSVNIFSVPRRVAVHVLRAGLHSAMLRSYISAGILYIILPYKYKYKYKQQ